MATTKSDPPEAADNGEKFMTIKLRPDDRRRLALARERTGIGNDTDILRHALARLCEQWEAATKVSER